MTSRVQNDEIRIFSDQLDTIVHVSLLGLLDV